MKYTPEQAAKLSGTALSWALAECMGKKPEISPAMAIGKIGWYSVKVEGAEADDTFEYQDAAWDLLGAMQWSCIQVTPAFVHELKTPSPGPMVDLWEAKVTQGPHKGVTTIGGTVLLALARMHVRLNLTGPVEVPDEIVKFPGYFDDTTWEPPWNPLSPSS